MKPVESSIELTAEEVAAHIVMDEREQLTAIISEHLGECSVDELRAVNVLLARLEIGRRKYGALDISTDPRDWNLEADEEIADLSIYLSFARLTRRNAR